MNRLYEPFPDYSRCRGYADAWGYRLGSNVAKLIDYLRDEHRAKYGLEYRLIRIGKNKYRVIPGNDHFYDTKSAKRNTPCTKKVFKSVYNGYGVSYAKQCAPMFGVTVI